MVEMAWRGRIFSRDPYSSKPEVLLREALQGIHEDPISGLSIVLRATRPDVSYADPSEDFHVYLDGPDHDGREDRDAWVTEQLERMKKRVLRVRFKHFSKAKAAIVAQEIRRIRRDIRLGKIPKPWVHTIDLEAPRSVHNSMGDDN